jgi:ABC-type sugar transport system substrate-binding protein
VKLHTGCLLARSTRHGDRTCAALVVIRTFRGYFAIRRFAAAFAATLFVAAASAQDTLSIYCSSPNTSWCQGMAIGFEKATRIKVSVTQKATGELQ